MSEGERFGAWVAKSRKATGWTQAECAERVQTYYQQIESDLPESERTTYSRSSWAKMEKEGRFSRVRESTVLHAALGLQKDLEECRKAAGLLPQSEATEDLSDLIGHNLAAARRGAGYSEADLAGMLGISVPRLRDFEAGSALPDAQQVYQMVRVLGITADALFAGKEFTTRIGASGRAMATKQDIADVLEEVRALKSLLTRPHNSKERAS